MTEEVLNDALLKQKENQLSRMANFMSTEIAGMTDINLIKNYIEYTFADMGLDPEDQKRVFSKLAGKDSRLRPTGVIWRIRVNPEQVNRDTYRLGYGAIHAEKFKEALSNGYKVEIRVLDGAETVYSEEIHKLDVDTYHYRLNLKAKIGKNINLAIENGHIIELVISKI